jgi:hypothetical protein
MFENYIHYVFVFEFNHVGFITVSSSYMLSTDHADFLCVRRQGTDNPVSSIFLLLIGFL